MDDDRVKKLLVYCANLDDDDHAKLLAGLKLQSRERSPVKLVGLGASMKALRRALGRSQQDVADASIGEDGWQMLQREEVCRVENGRNQGLAWRVRHGLARGFYLSDLDFEAFVAGQLPLQEAVGRSNHGKTGRKAPKKRSASGARRSTSRRA